LTSAALCVFARAPRRVGKLLRRGSAVLVLRPGGMARPRGGGRDARRFGKTVAMTRRALVLGAGGETGIAWEVGLLAGLAAHGVDLAAADLVVGTSAGAGVAARINSGVSLAALYEQQLAPADGEVVARIGPGAMAGLPSAAGRGRRQPRPARGP